MTTAAGVVDRWPTALALGPRALGAFAPCSLCLVLRPLQRAEAVTLRRTSEEDQVVNGRPIIRDGRLPEPGAVAGAGRVIRAA